jgi:hypothetical protein
LRCLDRDGKSGAALQQNDTGVVCVHIGVALVMVGSGSQPFQGAVAHMQKKRLSNTRSAL